jgi:hypothetical protein
MKSLLESADGSMATVATRRKNNNVPRTAKIDLTPTSLLMEGHYTFNLETGEARSMSVMAILQPLFFCPITLLAPQEP